MEAEQLKQIAEKASSLSTKMNKTDSSHVDVSNQINGTKGSLDTSDECIEGVETKEDYNGSIFEDSVKIEAASTDTATMVSEDSSKE